MESSKSKEHRIKESKERRNIENELRNKFYESEKVIQMYLQRAVAKFKERWENPIKASAKLEEFDIVRTLGMGAFGRVVLIQEKENYYAMKIMRRSKIMKLRQVQHTLNEKRVLGAINFPFAVSLISHFKDNSYIYMIMDYVIGGELYSLLKNLKQLTEDHARFYAAQIVLLFEYLHFMHIAHRDLKPENILIEKDGYLKLTDFGFAKKIPGRTWTICGTPEYIAPEVILSKGYNKNVDWWALGILIYEMVDGKTPFYDAQHISIYENIISGEMTFSSNFSTHLTDLLENLIQKDLTKRYGNLRNGIMDIKLHKWFSGLDWLSVYEKTLEAPYLPACAGPGDDTHFAKYEEETLLIANVEQFANEFKDF